MGGIRCFRGGSGFGLRLVFVQRGCKQLGKVETVVAVFAAFAEPK